jgi:TolA-binding protein
VEKNVEAIHMQLDRGERHLRSIEGVSGTISNLVSSDKQDKNMYFSRVANADRTLPQYEAGGGLVGSDSSSADASSDVARLSYAPSPHDPTPTALRAQLDQQDRDLEELSQLMMGLQGVAVTMNSELTRQSEQLNYLNLRTGAATQKTHDTNYRINEMI